MIQAFIPHVPAHYPTVCGDSGHGDAHVIIDLEHLLQSGRQLSLCAVQRGQHSVLLPLQDAVRHALIRGPHAVLLC